ncbi:MAG: branched-chain amino acid ABC transporter substrate-binding protein [Deltaproteobacteria bacterium]|nr:branched-chain amino acid ABC transporter substrate-binding protein [Deltaproteobacteria bacterium]
MTKKLWLSILMMACLGLLMAGPAMAADLKIGIMVPTTGSEATYGKDMENAYKLAVEEINAKGGVNGMKIVTVTADDACDPQNATQAASKLVSEGVTAVVGGYCSGATIPTLKIYGDAGIPFVVTAANSSKFLKSNPGNTFLVNSLATDQVVTAMDVFKAKGLKKLAIVHQGDAYSQDLAELTKDAWTKAGNQVVAYEVVNKGEQDFSALVTRLKSSGPDAVFWTAYYAEGGLLIKQLRQAGFTKLVIVGDGSNSPKLMEIGGKAAEGVLCLTNPTAELLPAAKTFSENYKKTFKSDPGPYSTLSYDGMKLLAAAIENIKSVDKKAIMEALKNTKDFTGIAGPISFTKDNTLARSNFVVVEAKGGKWVLFK